MITFIFLIKTKQSNVLSKIITIDQSTEKEINSLIMEKFHTCHWATSGRWVDLAKKLGLDDLVDEMEMIENNP